MLTFCYFLTAIIIGIAATASALAARRKFPSQLPAFNQEELGQDNPADTGVNILRDESSFSQRLGKVRFLTSIYHLVNKRH
jgi:hypothetical protein